MNSSSDDTEGMAVCIKALVCINPARRVLPPYHCGGMRSGAEHFHFTVMAPWRLFPGRQDPRHQILTFMPAAQTTTLYRWLGAGPLVFALLSVKHRFLLYSFTKKSFNRYPPSCLCLLRYVYVSLATSNHYWNGCATLLLDQDPSS